MRMENNIYIILPILEIVFKKILRTFKAEILKKPAQELDALVKMECMW